MLDGSFGFQLKMLQMESDARARLALQRFEISPARVSALMVIAANPGCTQTRLGDVLSVNRASAMKLVNFLEGRGLVVRKQASDPRANAVFLTRKGVSTLSDVTDTLREADRATLASLSDEEAATFVELVRRLRASGAASEETLKVA